jgi:phosphate transport system permease protein
MEQIIGGQHQPLTPLARLWRALSPTGNTGDAVFRSLLLGAALLMIVIVGAMILALASESMLSIRQFGFSFLTGRVWNPIKGDFGALPFVYGTIVSSLIALLISVPLSLGIAIFLVEQAPYYVARPLGFLVELLAAIPSVVYGLWGIFVLAPLAADISGDNHRYWSAHRRSDPCNHGDAHHLGSCA